MIRSVSEKLKELNSEAKELLDKNPDCDAEAIEVIEFAILQVKAISKDSGTEYLTAKAAAIKISQKAEMLRLRVCQDDFLIKLRTLLEIPRLRSETIQAAVNLMTGDNPKYNYIKASMQSAGYVSVKFMSAPSDKDTVAKK